MDQRQKSALRMNHITLADQLILDEDFFAQLRQIKIFSEGMISIIKAETKPRNQVYKMLELLEKRGPTAFDNFIRILRENFWWVADKLEETYQEKMAASQRNDQRDQQAPQLQQITKERLRKVQRAVSTPLRSRPQKPTSFPVQVSSSTSSFQESERDELKKDEPYKNEGTAVKSVKTDRSIQQTGADSEDEIDGTCYGSTVATGETYGESAVATPRKSSNEQPSKNYVDKSLSPIHILESSKKNVSNAICSPIPSQEYDRKVFNTSTDEQEAETNNFVPPITENETEEHLEETEDLATADSTDVIPERQLESSEVYYERVRTQSVFEDEDSSFYLHELRGEDDEEDDEIITADGGEDEIYRAYSCESSVESDIIEREDEDVRAIREIFLKLQWLTDEENRVHGGGVFDEENIKEVEETGITFQMIIEKLDELIEKHTNNDLLNLINSCYKFFDDKDKKLPLYTCIEKLRDARNELNSRLLDEMKKTNEMANDMYLHSQDMKNLEKLKTKLAKLETENVELRDKCETLEKLKTEQSRRISELEGMIINFSETRKEDKKVTRRTGISPKRSQMSQGLSPRKQPLYHDPRMAIMQTGYQSSKSPRTQAGASAWRPYKK